MTQRTECFESRASECYLGLSQLDRAQEYINEVEKLEPNIVCTFLKFKIYLQKNDQNGAITQVQAILRALTLHQTSSPFQPMKLLLAMLYLLLLLLYQIC